jgi:hypothetical protein
MASTKLEIITTVYSLPNGVNTQLYFDTISSNTLGATVTASALATQYNGITILSDAAYHIVGSMTFGGSTGTRRFWIDVSYDPVNSNNTYETVAGAYGKGSISGIQATTIHAIVYLRAGAKIRAMTWLDVAGVSTVLQNAVNFTPRTSLSVTPSMPLP